MKVSILIFAFTASLTILSACKKREDVLLSRIHSYVEAEGWEELFPMSKIAGGDDELYQFIKQDGDTSKALQLIYIPKEDRIVFHLQRTFYDSTHKHHLESNTDTLFYYRSPLDNEYELEFITGKYQYLYSRLKLSEGQHCFFEMHKDSLRSIRGNDLPPLPEKSCK